MPRQNEHTQSPGLCGRTGADEDEDAEEADAALEASAPPGTSGASERAMPQRRHVGRDPNCTSLQPAQRH